MDRRRTIALILGLLLCLALLGRWVVRSDNGTPPATPFEPSASTGSIAEIVQVPRDEPKDGGIVPYQAPIGPGVFRGRVIDAATREPIREFTVMLQQRRTESGELPPPLSRSFRTQDGRFEYSGLPAVTGNVFTTAPGYQRFNMIDVRIPENASAAKEILIPMRAGHVLRGRVIDELTKEAIASAAISFREAAVGRFQGDFRSRPSVRSGKDGSFVLDGVPPGAVVVEAGAVNYAGKETEMVASDQTPPMEIALSKGGTLQGYLADADGTPVAGEISMGNLDEDIAVTTSTGSAGEFLFAQLKAGRYLLAGKGDGLHGRQEIELSHNERREGIVLAMTPGHSVRGVVSGLRPEERAGTYVYLFAEGSRTGLAYNTTLDERGAYEIRGVAAGSVRIQVNGGARGVVTKTAQMPADTDLTLNVEFETGARLSGRVTQGGNPLAGAMLRPNSAALGEGSDVYLAPVATSANGEYSYEDVPKGDYVFMIESYSSPRVQVDGDTVFDIDVPEVQLSGYVFEEGGKVPVVGARIHLRPRPIQSQSSGLTDGSNNFGQFGIRGLQSGDYILSAYKSGYELYRAPFSYGSPVSDMTIYMRRARGVEIKVREAGSDKAIDNVIVIDIGKDATGMAMQLQTDSNGVSYLPSGFAGSTLRVSAYGYHPTEVSDWNGQQLDVSLQREE